MKDRPKNNASSFPVFSRAAQSSWGQTPGLLTKPTQVTAVPTGECQPYTHGQKELQQPQPVSSSSREVHTVTDGIL